MKIGPYERAHTERMGSRSTGIMDGSRARPIGSYATKTPHTPNGDTDGVCALRARGKETDSRRTTRARASLHYAFFFWDAMDRARWIQMGRLLVYFGVQGLDIRQRDANDDD